MQQGCGGSLCSRVYSAWKVPFFCLWISCVSGPARSKPHVLCTGYEIAKCHCHISLRKVFLTLDLCTLLEEFEVSVLWIQCFLIYFHWCVRKIKHTRLFLCCQWIWQRVPEISFTVTYGDVWAWIDFCFFSPCFCFHAIVQIDIWWWHRWTLWISQWEQIWERRLLSLCFTILPMRGQRGLGQPSALWELTLVLSE